MEKRQELYAGKAKSVYTTDDPDLLVLHFRDDTSAFDGKKKEALARKGMVNNIFNAFIMERLQEAGIPTHFEKQLSPTESLVKKMQMIPVECVVRNIAAGGLVKRLGIEEGIALTPPTFELFLKNDEKGDPMINESLAETFGWATPEQLAQMKKLTFKSRAQAALRRGRHAAGGLQAGIRRVQGRSRAGRRVLTGRLPPVGCQHP